MSAAGTVIATSADGAGDMPSPAPITEGDPTSDGAQPFSEVLSLSTAVPPGSSNPPSSPSPSAAPDEARTATPPAVVPSQAPAPRHTRSSSDGRIHRRSTDPGTGRPGPSALGSLGWSSATGEVDQISPSTSSGAESQSDAAHADQSPGAALPPVASLPPAPGTTTRDATSSTVGASVVPDGSSAVQALVAERGGGAQSGTPLDAEADGPGRSIAASVGPQPPDALVDTSTLHVDQSEVATVVEGTGRSGTPQVRVAPNRELPSVSVVPRVEGVRAEATASSSDATASPVLTTATDGSSDSLAVATEEVGDLTEFPQGEIGSVDSSVDISGLAASISRPLAAGNGDYSVQVSLHPPELGEVRALLSYQGDILHVTLTPEHSSGFEALNDAMPSLHDQLSGGGVEVNVTLSHPGDPQDRENGAQKSGGGAGVGSDTPTPAADASSAPPDPGQPGRINLVL
jgi:flagellar hook-length control protein FliK